MHLQHICPAASPKVSRALAGVGKDDPVLWHVVCCSALELLDTGAVKARTKRVQHGHL
jgi:hypothetical protein